MFTNLTDFHAIRSRQTAHGFSIASRSVLVDFSLGPRSSLVRLSLLSRQSIEDRTRTERGTSKKRTKEQRMSIEKIARSYRKLDEMPPSWLAVHPSVTTNQQNAFCLKSAEVNPCTFSPHRAFSRRIKPFRPSLQIPMVQLCRKPSTGF